MIIGNAIWNMSRKKELMSEAWDLKLDGWKWLIWANAFYTQVSIADLHPGENRMVERRIQVSEMT